MSINEKTFFKILSNQIRKSKRVIQSIQYTKFLLDVFRKKERFFANDVILKRKMIGTEYGSFCICPEKISPGSIVYSFGVGQDISFDLALIKKYGCIIFAFDPTPKSIDWIKQQTLPENFNFYPLAIANYDGKAQFFPPKNPNFVSHTLIRRSETSYRSIIVDVRRLSTIMKLLGHQSIDLLKMDIEGAEYFVIPDIEKSNIEIRQICLEFHHNSGRCTLFHHNSGRYTIQNTIESLKCLNKMGFKLFYQDRTGANTFSLLRL